MRVGKKVSLFVALVLLFGTGTAWATNQVREVRVRSLNTVHSGHSDVVVRQFLVEKPVVVRQKVVEVQRVVEEPVVVRQRVVQQKVIRQQNVFQNQRQRSFSINFESSGGRRFNQQGRFFRQSQVCINGVCR